MRGTYRGTRSEGGAFIFASMDADLVMLWCRTPVGVASAETAVSLIDHANLVLAQQERGVVRLYAGQGVGKLNVTGL